MILKLNHKFNHIFQGKAIETKILVAYRYTSLIITSVFYLLTYPEHEIMRKAIIICCLAISSIILSYLYPMFENSSKSIKALISMEIVGNIVLLMPSGGIRSPFIWHSLNTILISSVFLKKGYYWTHFAIYYFAYLLYNKFFNKETISVFEMIRGESNLFLSFIMITIAIHAFALLVNRAKEDG